MLYTSYFANIKNLPGSIEPIVICGKCPAWYRGSYYNKLAPKIEFFSIWKNNHDDDFYTRCFKSEVLDKLNVQEVVSELYKISNGRDIALICYEKPSDFCHRHIVAEWLNKQGFECTEWIGR